MADEVKSIVTALNNRLAVVLPNYSLLAFAYSPIANTFYRNSSGFGVTIAESSSAVGITKALTFEQTFKIILTEVYKATDSDEVDLNDKLFILSDNMVLVLKDLYWSKIGIPDIVMNVMPVSVSSPEIIYESGLIVLESTITVQWRVNLL